MIGGEALPKPQGSPTHSVGVRLCRLVSTKALDPPKQIDPAEQRADIVLHRPPLNVIEMAQRDQLRLVFEALDEADRVRVIVLRAIGEHFSSGGNIKGFVEASPEHVSKLAWNVASPARCAKPVIAANRGYCFGVGFEISLACDFRLISETCLYALPEQKLGQIRGSGDGRGLQGAALPIARAPADEVPAHR